MAGYLHTVQMLLQLLLTSNRHRGLTAERKAGGLSIWLALLSHREARVQK